MTATPASQQVRVIRHERAKYACPCCDRGLRLAAKPPHVIPEGLLSEAALAWVITLKHLDGLPLYRRAALLGRFGGTDLSRNTRLRDKSGREVHVPAYERLRDDAQFGARLRDILVAGVSTRRYAQG